jgi:hypothetical protein
MGDVCPELETPPSKVSSKRSAAKAVSWRVIGTFDTLVLSWLAIDHRKCRWLETEHHISIRDQNSAVGNHDDIDKIRIR